MAKYTGTVTKVVDGDTIHVKDDFGNKQIIRLFGIDTPEKRQEFGMEAKSFMASLVENKKVVVNTVNLGKYNRISALVSVNNKSLAEELLKAGLAFASGTNHRLANHYFALQEQASVKQIGMWKNGKPENPTLFRRRMSKTSYRNNPLFSKSKKNNDNSMYDIKRPLLQRMQDFIVDSYYFVKENINFDFLTKIKDGFENKFNKKTVNKSPQTSTPISHLDDKHFLDEIDGNILLKRYKESKGIETVTEINSKNTEEEVKEVKIEMTDNLNKIDGNILLNRINSRKKSNM